MKINSLGLRTDFMFYNNDAIISQRPDYIKVHTPDNHQYYWGNLLIFKNAHQKGDFQRWQKLFKEEFGQFSDIRHMTFCWDISKSNPTEISKFTDNGFEYDDTTVLIAERLNVEYLNKEIKIQKVISDDEWKNLVDFQIEVLEIDEGESDLEYTTKRFKDYRNMIEAGKGNWFVALLDGRIVSDLGLYEEDRIARFQDIKTHPEFRKKGIAQTLMTYASNEVTNDYLVIQAEDEGPAINMYKKIGFKVAEKIEGLCKYEY